MRITNGRTRRRKSTSCTTLYSLIGCFIKTIRSANTRTARWTRYTFNSVRRQIISRITSVFIRCKICACKNIIRRTQIVLVLCKRRVINYALGDVRIKTESVSSTGCTIWTRGAPQRISRQKFPIVASVFYRRKRCADIGIFVDTTHICKIGYYRNGWRREK